MRRKIYTSLLHWKERPDRKPLILEGARQVGKTYILKEFGTNEYDEMIYINCHNNPFMQTLFVSDFNMERIIRSLSAYSGKNIVAGHTLIFFDEVQDAPRTIESLKYFCEDAREQHVVVAGSLLGILDHKDESFPVGKVNTLRLYPMTYEEFLWAKSEENLADMLSQLDWEALRPLDNKLQDLLRQYYFVGGMPEVVLSFVTSNNVFTVRELQKEIIRNYNSDFSKHSGNETQRIRMVWKSLPSQLAKENKKFIYGAIKKGGRAKEFEQALQWLIDAGLVYKVARCKSPTMPLSIYEDESAFKLFALDTGLLGAMADAPAHLMLTGNDVFKEAKGSFTENYVMQQLAAVGDIGIYYFSKDNSTQEIDFLVQTHHRIIPIEAKAEENVKSKSLKGFVCDDHPSNNLKGLRASMKSYIDQGWMENVPLYSLYYYIEKETRCTVE